MDCPFFESESGANHSHCTFLKNHESDLLASLFCKEHESDKSDSLTVALFLKTDTSGSLKVALFKRAILRKREKRERANS